MPDIDLLPSRDSRMSTESSQWRKFLQPVVTGIVALMAAGVGYLQYLQKQDGEKRDSRIVELENRVSALENP